MKQNKNLLILVGFIIVIAVFFSIRFFTGGSEDTWICSNGEWIRHGSPKISQPKSPCPGKKSSAGLPSIPPDSTVINFYNWLKKQDNINENSTFMQSPYLVDSFKQKVSKIISSSPDEDNNPFTCGKSNLQNFKIEKSVTKGKKATVTVNQTFESGNKQISVNLETSGKDWKISNINCP